jgi:branched-subunit amino acid transport protein
MNVWILILGLGAFTYSLRVTGPLLLSRVKIPTAADKVLNNITPAVLSALVVAGMFTTERDLVLDERALGFVAAGIAVIAKLPPLVVIVVAAAATAAARAVL